jgi:solute:Na+ symporter, SSS family
VRPEADKTYVNLIRELVPTGIKGLLLAALFGAIQSTVSAVLNSTSTVLTLDFYRRYWNPRIREQDTVSLGRWITAAVLVFAILLGIWISTLQASLFVYIQALFTFFAPPFSAVFLLGTLWRRINGVGATTAVLVGFVLGIVVKVWVNSGGAPAWLGPYANQGVLNWAFCVIVCIGVSLVTAPPRPEQVTDALTFNWRRMNIGGDLGHGWRNVTLWWAGSVVLMFAFVAIFGFVL